MVNTRIWGRETTLRSDWEFMKHEFDWRTDTYSVLRIYSIKLRNQLHKSFYLNWMWLYKNYGVRMYIKYFDKPVMSYIREGKFNYAYDKKTKIFFQGEVIAEVEMFTASFFIAFSLIVFMYLYADIKIWCKQNCTKASIKAFLLFLLKYYFKEQRKTRRLKKLEYWRQLDAKHDRDYHAICIKLKRLFPRRMGRIDKARHKRKLNIRFLDEYIRVCIETPKWVSAQDDIDYGLICHTYTYVTEWERRTFPHLFTDVIDDLDKAVDKAVRLREKLKLSSFIAEMELVNNAWLKARGRYIKDINSILKERENEFKPYCYKLCNLKNVLLMSEKEKEEYILLQCKKRLINQLKLEWYYIPGNNTYWLKQKEEELKGIDYYWSEVWFFGWDEQYDHIKEYDDYYIAHLTYEWDLVKKKLLTFIKLHNV